MGVDVDICGDEMKMKSDDPQLERIQSPVYS